MTACSYNIQPSLRKPLKSGDTIIGSVETTFEYQDPGSIFLDLIPIYAIADSLLLTEATSQYSDTIEAGRFIDIKNMQVKFTKFVNRHTQLYEYHTQGVLVYTTPPTPPRASRPSRPVRPTSYPPRDYDTIVLNNGETIVVLISEITSREIRYRLFDQPDIARTISTNRISEIIHKNGSVENFANRTSIGISADPSGFALFGPEVGFEITKGKMNYQIQARFSSMGNQNSFDGGLDVGAGVYRLLKGRENGFYLGGIGEYSFHKIGDSLYHYGALSASAGYRIVFDNGINIRLGADVGGRFNNDGGEFVWRPVTSVGYNF